MTVPSDTPLLKVAIPNKGMLSEASVQMFTEAGYGQRTNSRDLIFTDRANGVRFYYLRPRDIAVYVGQGTLDLGITGRDLLADSKAGAEEVLGLGFGPSTFRLAAPVEAVESGRIDAVADLAGLRVATSYPTLLKRFLAEHQVSADVVRLDGAVESAVGLGVADAVADVVSTGGTLRQAGLRLFGPVVLSSEAIVIRRPDNPESQAAVGQLVHRLRGVIVARTYVMLDYDIETRHLNEATELTPGFESPTISPLAREGWVAVRAMVPRADVPRVMDDLYALGARAILATSIHAARL